MITRRLGQTICNKPCFCSTTGSSRRKWHGGADLDFSLNLTSPVFALGATRPLKQQLGGLYRIWLNPTILRNTDKNMILNPRLSGTKHSISIGLELQYWVRRRYLVDR